jgi:hypothetical protein
MKLYVEKGLNFDQTIGFSTMTMLLIPKALSFKKFLVQKSITERNTHPVLLIWPQMSSLCLQK